RRRTSARLHAIGPPRLAGGCRRRRRLPVDGKRLRDRNRAGGRRRETHPLRDVVIVGGGCYGTFYATQLAKAKARGKIEYRTVIVVDRDSECRARRELGEAPDRQFTVLDWTAFFDAFFVDAVDDYIVPSPHMPHLMFEWVLRRARARWPRRTVGVEPVPGTFPTPYDRPS